MIQWDIDFDLIPVNDDTKKRQKLTERGLAGWEPYAIVGVTHYYKRHISVEPIKVPEDKGSKNKNARKG